MKKKKEGGNAQTKTGKGGGGGRGEVRRYEKQTLRGEPGFLSSKILRCCDGGGRSQSRRSRGWGCGSSSEDFHHPPSHWLCYPWYYLIICVQRAIYLYGITELTRSHSPSSQNTRLLFGESNLQQTCTKTENKNAQLGKKFLTRMRTKILMNVVISKLF